MNTILLHAQGGGGLGMPLMLLLVFGVMYFFMIRPQKKKEKELAQKREEVKKGDEVITAGGIHGKIFEIAEDTVVISVESAAKIRIEKSSIAVINGEGAGTPKK